MLESMQVQQVFQNNNNNNNNNNKDYLKCSQWPSCKFYTTNEVSLKNHELSHVPPVAPLYNCAQCNLTFAQVWNLRIKVFKIVKLNFLFNIEQRSNPRLINDLALVRNSESVRRNISSFRSHH